MALTRLGLNQSINLATNITGTLPTGNGGTGATSFSPGKILQVINSVNGTIDSTTSSSLANTSTTASITPSATSSKILVIAKVNGIYCRHESTSLDLAINRDSTQIVDFGGTVGYNTEEGSNDSGQTGDGVTFLDTPSSTSSLTYTIRFASSDNSNQIQINNYIRGSIRPKSSITLMEIGA
jgi:hypothetical protein